MDGTGDTIASLGPLLDDEELAQRARTTLAGSDDGVLVIAHGLAPLYRECPVSVRDDDGEAVLGAPAAGPVAEAARQRCHAALLLRPVDPDGVALTLIGRISAVAASPSGDPATDGAGQMSIALTVERVLVSNPCEELIDAGQPRREISLATYATAEPDLIAANARRLAEHLTFDHQDQLRVLAALCLRRPVSHVIAAQISQLTRSGLRLWWVDGSGAQPAEISFSRQAESLVELGELVREVLGSSR